LLDLTNGAVIKSLFVTTYFRIGISLVVVASIVRGLIDGGEVVETRACQVVRHLRNSRCRL
jgi:hypothetical protein